MSTFTCLLWALAKNELVPGSQQHQREVSRGEVFSTQQGITNVYNSMIRHKHSTT